jgi:hypothetical protein
LTFTKVESSSPIYVMYHDTLRVTGTTSSWCRWEVLIDGDPCTSPGAIYTDLHEDGSNIHRTSPVAGFCTATAKGSIGAGSHTITVRHQRPGGRGQCYTGWDNVRGHLFVDELAF